MDVFIYYDRKDISISFYVIVNLGSGIINYICKIKFS